MEKIKGMIHSRTQHELIKPLNKQFNTDIMLKSGHLFQSESLVCWSLLWTSIVSWINYIGVVVGRYSDHLPWTFQTKGNVLPTFLSINQIRWYYFTMNVKVNFIAAVGIPF